MAEYFLLFEGLFATADGNHDNALVYDEAWSFFSQLSEKQKGAVNLTEEEFNAWFEKKQRDGKLTKEVLFYAAIKRAIKYNILV